MLGEHTNGGISWLVIVTITVSLMAIGMAMWTMTSVFDSELPYAWRLVLMLAFGAVMVPVIVLSMARSLKARRLALYCSDCAAILTAKRLSSPEEFGAHKIRMKKE